jgi:hypothetical protein
MGKPKQVSRLDERESLDSDIQNPRLFRAGSTSRGLGIFSAIPNYIIWSLVLFIVGIAIIAGVKTNMGD